MVAQPFVNEIAMCTILLTVAILDGPYLMRRLGLPAPRADQASGSAGASAH
jgi:hypothetical protein